MRILTIGYYDDFARFFLAIQKRLTSKNRKTIFRYESIYISGFLYMLSNFKGSSCCSLIALFNSLVHRKKYKKYASASSYKGVNLDKVINYNLKTSNCSKDELKILAASYTDYFERIIESFNPDIAILSGDTRMSVEILKTLLESKNVKILFFEQGPFKSTIIDEKGVNASTSFANIFESEFVDNAIFQEIDEMKRQKKYFRIPLFRLCDYLLLFLGLAPKDWLEKEYPKQRAIKPANYIRKKKNITDYCLILQVPLDANMVHHSPFFKSHEEIVKNIYENLPKNSTLHLLFKSRYERGLYDFAESKNIKFIEMDLNECLKQSDIIIVNNSTVGIEAIEQLKPTIVLGNCYYKNSEICIPLNSKNDLERVLLDAKEYKVSKNKVTEYLNFLIKKCLIKGHFRNSSLDFVDIIIKKL